MHVAASEVSHVPGPLLSPALFHFMISVIFNYVYVVMVGVKCSCEFRAHGDQRCQSSGPGVKSCYEPPDEGPGKLIPL